MARQVRLDDEIAEFVASSGPEEDSLTAKANRLLRQVRENMLDRPAPGELEEVLEPDPPPLSSPEVAMPEARARPARPRARSISTPHSDASTALHAASVVERLRASPSGPAGRPVTTSTSSKGACPHPVLLRRGGVCGKCGDPIV